MKKLLAFGASSSQKSINKQFATFAANSCPNSTTSVLDLNDFEMPIYSIDREKNEGIPALAREFKKQIKNADGIIISFAEHNGAYSAAFKNIYDWVSRIEKDVWENKPILLLATSPGERGALGVLELAYNTYSRNYNNFCDKFSLPSFQQNFSNKEGVLNKELNTQFSQIMNKFQKAL